MSKEQSFAKPSLILSLIPVVFLIILLSLNVIVYHDNSSYGPNQFAMLLASCLSALIGVFILKIPYKVLEKKALETVSVATQPIIILLIVGALIGVWILNGVVPTMIFYGIKLISPTIFLPITLVICSVVSLATGSSWSTVGTVGIALIGIGKTLGIPEEMVAGAIVSGSYFGDKMSPLSDTTNLAPAMVGADLFEHIKHMLFTTGPAFIISLVIFSILGMSHSAHTLDAASINEVLVLLKSNFNISVWLFLLPLIVLFLVQKKLPAIPTLLLGTFLGVIFALIFQQDLLGKMTEAKPLSAYEKILEVAFSGFKMESGNVVIDKLFSRGGMSSMLNTMWIIFMAMIYGGMMEVTGMLNTIASKILSVVKGIGSLVAATVGSSLFLNLTTSDQYISIVVSGRMFKEAYKDYGLKSKNLSRAVEDGATVTSVLIPWNTCGAYFSSIMGVSTLAYLPFAFFNLLSPVMSILVAMSGKTMEKIEK
ncbi:MAG: Na+/H+ antiporter NhaC [Bacteriovoracaceae bacterium]|jgi:NhaC family Na+:H+ antiporter|nr:Na+/H+ antiporter NhaC [Bacteriovoracaceae bacterium]